MRTRLVEDALGSMLYRFFGQTAGAHETEEELVGILWRAVAHYRQTGEFSMAVVVCPQYSPDYTRLLPGTSLTARRSIHMYKLLKEYLQRHMSYGSKVSFRTLLFDQEHRQFEHMGIDPEEAQSLMDASAASIERGLRKGGTLPECFKAMRLTDREGQGEWTALFGKAKDHLDRNDFGPGEPFDHPERVFQGLRSFYRKVMNTDDVSAHRAMFNTEEGPGYLSGGHFVRKKLGPHTLQVDVGSDPALARMNLWQPPDDRLTDTPSLIRLRNPKQFDSEK